MSDNKTSVPIYERSPLVQLYISILTMLVAGMFLFFVFVVAGMEAVARATAPDCCNHYYSKLFQR